MPFFTPGSEKFVSESGSGLVKKYAPKVLPDGTVELIEDGVFDLYAQIQADAEANSIQAVLKRFENGDTSGFSGQPIYGDFTEMPTTYAEFLQAQINAYAVYENLPPEIKQKFDNDRDQFFATAGSEEWIDKMTPEKVNKEKEGDSSES